MFTRLRLPLLTAFGGLAAGLLLAQTGGAMAQAANGTITGQVLWGNCIRGIPLPAAQDSGQAQPSMPVPASGQPSVTGLPAGAVLVAVQGTPISSRTDETGHFTLSSVPAGQYLTVAAGPVANAANAVAQRPNVFVSGGQSVDLGTLNLGGNVGGPISIACRAIPGPQSSTGAVGATPDTTQPTPDTPPDGTPDVN